MELPFSHDAFLDVFGAYNWRNQQLTYTTASHKNSETMVAFLERLLDDYPRQKLVLVMDNASYHHSKTTKAALSLYEGRLLVIWLPKYSPFLNPIERFWLHFKQLAVANRLHTSLADLQRTVHAVMHDMPGVHATGVVTAVQTATLPAWSPDEGFTPARPRYLASYIVTLHPSPS